MLRLLVRSADTNLKSYPYFEVVSTLKALRDLRYEKSLQDKIIAQLDALDDDVTARGIMVWGHCLQSQKEARIFARQAKSKRVTNALNGIGAVALLSALSRFNVSDESLIMPVAECLATHAATLNAWNISTVLNALCKLEFNSPNVISAVARRGAAIKADFTPQGVTLCLASLAKLGDTGDEHFASFVNSLKENIQSNATFFTAEGTSRSVQSLLKLGTKEDDASLRALLLQGTALIPKMPAQSVAMFCTYVARIKSFPDATATFLALVDRALVVIDQMTAQGLTMVVRGVVEFESNDDKVIAATTKLMHAAATRATHMCATFPSMSIVYFLAAYAKSGRYDESLVMALCDRALTILEEQGEPSQYQTQPAAFNGQEVGSFLRSLSILGIKNDRLHEALIDHARTWALTFDGPQCVSFLLGCSRSSYEGIDQELVSMVQTRVLQELDSLDDHAFSNAIMSYIGTGNKNDEFIQMLVRAFERRVPTMSFVSMTVVIGTLRALQWPDFRSVLERCVEKLDPTMMKSKAVDHASLARMMCYLRDDNVRPSPEKCEQLLALALREINRMHTGEVAQTMTGLGFLFDKKDAANKLKAFADAADKHLAYSARTLRRPDMYRVCYFFYEVRLCPDPETQTALLNRMMLYPMRNIPELIEIARCLRLLSSVGVRGVEYDIVASKASKMATKMNADAQIDDILLGVTS